MYSFSFPKLFNHTTANLAEDKEAIRSNMLALLHSERNTLFGDPYFGCQLKKYMFEQSTSIVVDLLIDHLYTTIVTFMPQVYITRKDINIYVDSKNSIKANINYRYVVDNTTDLFTIKLTESVAEN